MNKLIAIFCLALLTACAGQPTATVANAKPHLEFLDLEVFDRQLSTSLGAGLTSVNVEVMNAATATAIPERLQTWLHSVEAGGGTVKVSPPQSGVTAKNPLLLLSLVSGVWNSIKATKAVSAHELHKAAQKYDAEIVLKIDDKGERLIDRIIFTGRKEPERKAPTL